jgi:hypothetical protein
VPDYVSDLEIAKLAGETTMATSAHQGGCLCGGLRYRIKDEGLALTACHCTDCQRSGGAAFGMSLLLLKASAEVVKGTPRTFTKIFEDDGRLKHNKFCGECGVRIWTEFSKFPQVVNVKPGTLDDTSWLEPVAHIWVRSKQPWVSIPEGALQFETQPADFSVVLKAFAAQRAGVRR